MIILILILFIFSVLLGLNKRTGSIILFLFKWLSSIIFIFRSFLIMTTIYVDKLYDGLSIFSGFISINSINQIFQIIFKSFLIMTTIAIFIYNLSDYPLYIINNIIYFILNQLDLTNWLQGLSLCDISFTIDDGFYVFTGLISPGFVTGISDGDGCFSVKIAKSKTKTGWSVGLVYYIIAGNNAANLEMLKEIQKYFGGIGLILTNVDNTLCWRVTALSDCLIIQKHFMAHPLMTYKLVHFQLWSAILNLMLTGVHLTREGLLQIVAMKAHFPKGLSTSLQLAFPDYVSIPVPTYLPDLSLINISWIAGFISADGNFSISVSKDKNRKTGFHCTVAINIIQHDNSKIVLEGIKEYLGHGAIYKMGENASYLRIFNQKGVNNFITKFNSYHFSGAKALDYIDFCKGMTLINNKAHLTVEGIKAIQVIAAGMNKGRTFFGS